MAYRIEGLDPNLFADLRGLSEAALAERGVRRVRIEAAHAAPCRISLDDAAPGEAMLLLNYDHQPADTPYRQQGPIFVRQEAAQADYVDVIPPALARRTLSLRGFDAKHTMIEADLTEGVDAPALIGRLFANPDVAYIHAHYARRGCFAAAVTRA